MSNTEPNRLIADWLSAQAKQAKPPAFSAEIGIPNYREKVQRHYAPVRKELERVTRMDDFGAVPDVFGLRITFASRVTAAVHDDQMILDPNIRRLADTFGPLSLINIEVPKCLDGNEQRNIFPNLHFHIDRGADQPNQFSMFLRDPADPAHQGPRDTSSLFVANAVGHLQAVVEGASPVDRRLALYKIFKGENVPNLINEIIFEHAWQAPSGTGEVAILNNRTMLHASYHRKQQRGYPIGVRYLY